MYVGVVVWFASGLCVVLVEMYPAGWLVEVVAVFGVWFVVAVVVFVGGLRSAFAAGW